MSVVSLERRLRKIEAKRRKGGEAHAPAFFVFGRDGADIAARISVLTVKPADIVIVPWPLAEAPPEPRWATIADLTDRELYALTEEAGAPGAAAPTDREKAVTMKMSDAELHAAIMDGLLRDNRWTA